jgi:hypothetical protein
MPPKLNKEDKFSTPKTRDGLQLNAQSHICTVCNASINRYVPTDAQLHPYLRQIFCCPPPTLRKQETTTKYYCMLLKHMESVNLLALRGVRAIAVVPCWWCDWCKTPAAMEWWTLPWWW